MSESDTVAILEGPSATRLWVAELLLRVGRKSTIKVRLNPAGSKAACDANLELNVVTIPEASCLPWKLRGVLRYDNRLAWALEASGMYVPRVIEVSYNIANRQGSYVTV